MCAPYIQSLLMFLTSGKLSFFFPFCKPFIFLLGGGGGGYGLLNGSPEMRYPAGAFGDGYGGVWGQYDKRGPPRR